MATEGRKKPKGKTDVPTDYFSVGISNGTVGFRQNIDKNPTEFPSAHLSNLTRSLEKKVANFSGKNSLSDGIFRRTFHRTELSDEMSDGIFRRTRN